MPIVNGGFSSVTAAEGSGGAASQVVRVGQVLGFS